MRPVAVIFNDRELVRLLARNSPSGASGAVSYTNGHLGLPVEFPKFKPAPQASLYGQSCGPPDDYRNSASGATGAGLPAGRSQGDCDDGQPDPKGELYETIEPAPADD